MLSAFGASAQRYAPALEGFDVILTDLEHVGEAYVEAIHRHERGSAFYGMLLLDDTRTRTLEMIAPPMLAHFNDFDGRRAAMDAAGNGTAVVNGRPTAELFVEFDPGLRQAAIEFFLLSGALLVRSHTEYARLGEFCRRPRAFERIVVPSSLPRVDRRPPAGPAVVVWAPHLPAELSALYAFALYEFKGAVTVVVGEGTPPADLPATFLRVNDERVAEHLAVATAVIATHSTDPSDAVAFAARGYGVAAPITSGAHEYVRNIVSYDPGFVRTIQIAASTAIARPTSIRELPARPPRAPEMPSIELFGPTPPLVSIVLPTYNRREDIARALECIASQTYPNIEAVIVNDGGEAIDDLVAAHPFARLINMQKNVGGIAAMNTGMASARGEFVQMFADDDWLFPDHVTRLIAALKQSGASVAHSNGLIRHQKRRPDRTLETFGFNAGIFLDTTTPSDALIATPIVLISVMFRRSVFDVIEPLADIRLADHDIQLRASERWVFAYVDHTTVEWRLRGESVYADMDSPAGMRHIFDDLHPRPQRPMIEQMRAIAVSNVERRPRGQYMFPPTITISAPPEPS